MKIWRFTIADAAVVVLTCVLLLVLIRPAGLHAGKYGMEAMCRANVRGLLGAWALYYEDNDGHLVGGSTYYDSQRRTPYRWVECPLYSDTDNPGAPPEGSNSRIPYQDQLTHEYRLNGIRAGKLYPYVEDVTLYHCPADRNSSLPLPTYAAYRSYSIAGLMNGEDFTQRSGWPGYVPPYGWRTVALPDGGSMRLKFAEKGQDIISPAQKYVFVEEDGAVRQQPYLMGSFILMAANNYWSWWDVPAMYHGEQSVLGFADGHVDVRRWTDMRTICFAKQEPLPGTTTIPGLLQPDNPDLEYMNRGYMACE